MKNLSTTILILIAIFMGSSIVLFILRMIWSPPHSMGMMMESTLMYQHMQLWLRGTLIVFFTVIFSLFIIWLIRVLLRYKD